MSRVTKTIQAERDLDEIWLNIALNNIDAADRLLDRIAARLGLLATQPLSGRARPELLPALRCVSVGVYLLFYLPMTDGINLARVLHGARDVGPEDFEAAGSA